MNLPHFKFHLFTDSGPQSSNPTLNYKLQNLKPKCWFCAFKIFTGSIIDLKMGGENERSSRRNIKKNSSSSSRRKRSKDAYTESDNSTSDTEEERKNRRNRSHRDKKYHKSKKAERIEESSSEDSSDEDYRRRKDKKRRRKRKRERRDKRNGRSKRRHIERSSDEDSESPSSADMAGEDQNAEETPEKITKLILNKFPYVKQELKQLLKMIDDGQAIDIEELSNKAFLKLLKKLFKSLKLKRTGRGLYLLPRGGCPCLEAVGSVIECDTSVVIESQSDHQREYQEDEQSDLQGREAKYNDGIPDHDANHVEVSERKADSPSSTKRRVIGPAMPSAEMLEAAAKLTEAEAALRDAEKELENDVLIGPPPPAAVVEAESANDAERFEEVTRIIPLNANNPYDVLGLNRGASAESTKKRYWKLSLLVHPDKCSHPQAHQAFTILNQAFKDLQDPIKRAAIDDKIIIKEAKEEFEADLKARREAAQWRRIRGEAISGDDELLAEVKLSPKRDEWMTTLPPERKPGPSMHSTFFSKSEKPERGDTSIWTDTPLEKAHKAKQHYLEAYNQAALTALDEDIGSLEKEHSSATADLMDKYNKSKRSMSLVEKHKHEQKKKSKKVEQSEKQPEEEWSGKHPWKPWDRETDLTAGRKSVNFDANNFTKGLTSRFSSGSVERSFL